jgi:hypothetical protein
MWGGFRLSSSRTGTFIALYESCIIHLRRGFHLNPLLRQAVLYCVFERQFIIQRIFVVTNCGKNKVSKYIIYVLLAFYVRVHIFYFLNLLVLYIAKAIKLPFYDAYYVLKTCKLNGENIIILVK